MFKNNLKLIRQMLYKLKMEFGLPATYRRRLSNTVNLTTGVIAITYDDHYIRRAILLPNDTGRKFDYDLTYIAANKNFTYGGFYDPSARTVIIQRGDLPRHLIPNMNDMLVFNERQYEISKIDEAENVEGYILTLKDFSAKPSVEVTR